MKCKKMTCGERKKFCRECEYHQPAWKYRFCNFTTCPYRIRDSTFRKKPLKRDFFHRKEVVGMNGLNHNSFVPYIFTHEQIAYVIKAADETEPREVARNMHLALPVIFRILYGCGLRVSEVVGLRYNLQRETILPSERAFAYKMKMDAIKHQGARSDLTSCQLGTKLRADEKVGEDAGESARTVQRYIRLTELCPELLDMVDSGQIKFNPAVELSYLAKEEQKEFLEAMDYAQAAPSLSQAQRIKKLAQEGDCTLDAMCEIMNEMKKDEMDKVTLKTSVLRKYFPKSYTNKQMEDKIIQLLEQWQKKREKSMER